MQKIFCQVIFNKNIFEVHDDANLKLYKGRGKFDKKSLNWKISFFSICLLKIIHLQKGSKQLPVVSGFQTHSIHFFIPINKKIVPIMIT